MIIEEMKAGGREEADMVAKDVVSVEAVENDAVVDVMEWPGFVQWPKY